MKTFAKLSAAFALMILSCLSAHAFSVKRDALSAKGIFGIEFPDGTSLFAKSDLICVISIEKYFLGAMIISEVNIQFLGQPALLRIYNISEKETYETLYDGVKDRLPKNKTARAAPEELLRRLEMLKAYPKVKSALEEAQKVTKIDFVAKEYPATTHSKTNEYVVSDLEELLLFYKRITLDFAKYISEDDVPEKMEGSIYVIEKQSDEKN